MASLKWNWDGTKQVAPGFDGVVSQIVPNDLRPDLFDLRVGPYKALTRVTVRQAKAHADRIEASRKADADRIEKEEGNNLEIR